MSEADPHWKQARGALPADAIVAGVDEVGRGPLVGDVVAAAVVLGGTLAGEVKDSKSLSAARRETLAARIAAEAPALALGRATPAEIDELNILHATMLAMARAVAALPLVPALVLVDGNRLPDIPYPAAAVVRGDALVPEISAASIVAKVTRDREMLALDERYPGYGFAAHKGYPTAVHLAALGELGPTPAHRRSFRPVREALLRSGTDTAPGRGTAP